MKPTTKEIRELIDNDGFFHCVKEEFECNECPFKAKDTIACLSLFDFKAMKQGSETKLSELKKYYIMPEFPNMKDDE